MKIIDPQSAVLTNIEVLAYITANPPRRPPNPPPNSRNWVPSPDLRDHNTVVREIHNYIHRLSPHLLKYPAYIHGEPPQSQQQPSAAEAAAAPPTLPPVQPSTPTPIDLALRELVTRLKPFGLTKGEVVMIVNLGVGVDTSSGEPRAGEEEGEGGEQDQMEVDEVEEGNEGVEEAGGESGGGGLSEEDYGALALLDTVIEEREERLSEDDVAQILTIIRETLGSKRNTGSVG
ncbi:hypothetical protein IFM61606_04345 [Aspergillus udagawae]|uniref:DNA-directed RNA polymerase III subunit RPC9 n=1 Tax=Aspergillus udagawae TaxID=91492 RepID=A0ABQ1B220_9EURO|nr:hypothetical protein IFM51744_04771 [Aspergillus udagawae]GFF90867.1 hypothetical protein IFM53868_06310 [Aspergillus udagawae]GFG24436.1 hypothetical protein IFM61606_04345 [Aspergillus udagawae]